MDNHRSYCPVNLALEVFGDKWSLIILRDIMFENKRHFQELRHSEEKIASNILTDRLNMLEKEGLITKVSDPTHKQKNIYNLTEKGIDLIPVFAGIAEWSVKHMPVDAEKYHHAVALSKGDKDMQKQIKIGLIMEHLV